MSHAPAFEALAAHLHAVRGGRAVDFLANPGNWGDGLIRTGTLRFFEHFGVPFREVFPDRPYQVRPGGVAVYGGSGGWCRFWPHGPGMVRQLATRYRHVVVLPTTYGGPVTPAPNVSLWARDRFESRRHAAGSRFCHDMAFFLAGAYAADPAVRPAGVGYLLRTDRESVRGRVPLPPGNHDLSHDGNHLTPVEPFFARIGEYAAVVTDRLHVAVGGYLLGRRVFLLERGYFKSRAVYLSSLAGSPRVSFHAWTDAPELFSMAPPPAAASPSGAAP